MSSVFSDAEAAPPAADYLVYLNEAIEEGLADADANRTVPVEEFVPCCSPTTFTRQQPDLSRHEPFVTSKAAIEYHEPPSHAASRFAAAVDEAIDRLDRFPEHSAGVST